MVYINERDTYNQEITREIGCYNDYFALKYERYLGSAAAGVSVYKYQSDWKSLNPNFADSRLHEILR